MSGQPELPAPDDKKLADLATGFALGELSEAELGELYHRLQAEGESGDTAARTVWETMGATLSLKSTIGNRFQDTLALRIKENESRGRSFIGSVAARLGLSRPSLTEIAWPSGAAGAGAKTIPVMVGLGILLLAGLLALFWPGWRGAKLTATGGAVTCEGSPVGLGSAPANRPLTLAAASFMELRWPDGTQGRIFGPGSVVIQENGLSLAAGRTELRLGGDFRLGLPDGQVHGVPPAQIAVEIHENRSLIGVSQGRVEVTGEGPARQLTAGQTAAPGGTVCAWIPTVECAETHLASGRQWRPAWPTNAPGWRLKATVQWAELSDQLNFDFSSAGAPATAGEPAEAQITLRPGRIIIRPPGIKAQVIELAGAPLLAREIELRAWPDRRAQLTLEGAPNAIALPFAQPPAALTLQGEKAQLAGLTARTGPLTGGNRATE